MPEQEAKEIKPVFKEIVISSGGTEAKIAPERGGLVTSFSVNGNDIFFLDRETLNDPTKSVRGGIPMLFPNAGPLKEGPYSFPQHGFARKMPWNVIGQNQNSVTLQLQSNEETRENYPFDFELQLKVEVNDRKLTHIMTIKNTGDKPMPTAYGIHPYFEIPDGEKASIITNIKGFDPEKTDWTKEFDQSFENPGLVKVNLPEKEIKIESDPHTFTNFYVWLLPGKDFVCIEPWTRKDNALNDPSQSLWIKPGESQHFPIIFSVNLTKEKEQEAEFDYVKEGERVVNKLGLRPFLQEELKQMADGFKKDLQGKMEGKESSLLMIPTYLKSLEQGSLPIGKKALSIAIGGSMIRAALTEVGIDGKLGIIKNADKENLFFQEELPKKEFANAEEFWNLVVSKLPKEMLQKPDALALIWGFAANTIETPYGIDALAAQDHLEKDIAIPGISGTTKSPLGKQFFEALIRRLKNEDIILDETQLKEIPIVVANDTAALAIAVPGTKIAAINGTGYNMAVAIGKFYNMEACEFNQVKQNELDRKVDAKSNSPGNSLAEKQISGLYIGNQLKTAVEALMEHGFPIHLKKELAASDLDIMLSGNRNKLIESVENTTGGQIEDALVKVLQEIADIIRERSAGAFGTYLGATISAFPSQFPPDQIVKVAFDGSVIRYSPQYQELAGKYAREVCLRNIQFVDAGKYADLIGAGGAALSKIS